MDDTMKEMALCMLAKQITDSEFTKLEVSKVEDGMCVCMSGQTFGIIGALGTIVGQLSADCDIPVDKLANLVGMAGEIALAVRDKGQDFKFDSKDELLDFAKRLFGTEGKN